MFKYVLLLELAIFMVGYVSAAPAVVNNSVESQRKDEVGKYVVDGYTGETVEVSKIISQVENILSINPQLPRLTRGQILNLLKNITIEDNKTKDLGVTGKPKTKPTTPSSTSKEQSTKPIMVVLPYNAANTEASKMVDLYTKPPIVTFVTEAPPQKEELEIINEDGSKLYSAEFKNHKYSTKGISKVEYKVESEIKDFWKEQAQNAMKDLVNSNKEPDVKTDMSFKQLPSTLGEMKFVTDIPEIVEIKLSTKYKNEAGDGDVDFYPNDEEDKAVEEQLKDLLSTVDKYSKNHKTPIYPMLPGQNEYHLLYDQISQESKQPSSETSAYSEFKPLPISMMKKSKPVSKDVEEILSSYGILGSSDGWAPSQIKMENNEVPLKEMKIDPNMFPADMTSMLTEMGLTGRKDRMMEKPTASALTAGPDPLLKEDEEIVESNDIKKRQQSEETITTEPTTTQEPTTTTEESNDEDSKASSANETPSLADLESSFGASPADDDPSEAVLPPPMRNGFYYMLDWNSFLEVGEGDKRVNIRFDPKLGDPQRFLKVTVP